MKKATIILAIFTIALIAIGSTTTSDRYERIYIEEWMTQPFMGEFEEELVIEDWMIKPF